MVVIFIQVVVSFIGRYPKYVQCDVGQGDSSLISVNTSQIVFDVGSDDSAVKCLYQHLPFWDKYINLLVLTHNDEDHIGGLESFLSHYDVDVVLWNGVSSGWDRLQTTLAEYHNSVVINAKEVETINLDDIELKMFTHGGIANKTCYKNENYSRGGPNQSYIDSDNENDQSVVSIITFNDKNIMITGDITSSVEEILVDCNFLPSNIDILKVAHHGSKFSSSNMFINAINPKYALISVGENKYGHPDPEILSRFEKFGVEVMRTDKMHDILIKL